MTATSLDLTPERLAEIRERAEKATPGDWWAWDRGVGYHIAVSMELDQWDTPADLLPGGSRTDIGRLDDAEFIAHARQDVPALLAEVERLNRVAHVQSGMVSELTSTCLAAEAERDRLREVVDKVRSLHSEFRIYEDCGHAAHEDDADVIDLNDIGIVCRSGYLYSICRECCAPGDSQTEECVDQHDHSECWPCPTRKVVGE